MQSAVIMKDALRWCPIRSPASASGWPATAAWWARRSCAGSPREDCEVLTAERAALDLNEPGRGVGVGRGRTGPTSCSSPRRRSAASSPTTRCPADFLYDNLMIEANVIDAAHRAGVEKLLFLGSSCIYPEVRRAADPRGRAAHRAAGADQRVVRDRQDRRHQAGARPIAGSTAATSSRRCRPISTGRATISISHSSHVAAGADPQGARGEDARRPRDRRLGHRHAAPRVPARRRLRRRLRPPDEGLFGRRATSISAPARTSPSWS